MDQNIFFSQQDADHLTGDWACTLMSRMETRDSSLIIFFIFVDCHNTASNRYPGKEVVTPDKGSFHTGLRLFSTVSPPF